jgi:hypothetical protein
VGTAPVKEVDTAPVEESEVNREETKKEDVPSSDEADSAVETTPLKNPEEA